MTSDDARTYDPVPERSAITVAPGQISFLAYPSRSRCCCNRKSADSSLLPPASGSSVPTTQAMTTRPSSPGCNQPPRYPRRIAADARITAPTSAIWGCARHGRCLSGGDPSATRSSPRRRRGGHEPWTLPTPSELPAKAAVRADTIPRVATPSARREARRATWRLTTGQVPPPLGGGCTPQQRGHALEPHSDPGRCALSSVPPGRGKGRSQTLDPSESLATSPPPHSDQRWERLLKQ